MAILLDVLGQRFDTKILHLVSDHIGAPEDATRGGVVAALPLLVGAVAVQGRAQNAEALDAVLASNHDGTLFEHLETVLDRTEQGASLADVEPWVIERLELDPAALNGDGILDHLVGDRRERVALAISRGSTLRPEQVNHLLAVLAPIVMSALGHVKRAHELGAGGLRDLLREAQHALQSALDTDAEAPALLDFLEVDPRETLSVTTRTAAALRNAARTNELFTNATP